MPGGTTVVKNNAVIDAAEVDPTTSNLVETTITVIANGFLKLTKVVDTGSAPPDDFSFTISPDPNGQGAIQTTNGMYVFENLPAGEYTITESPFGGYHQVSTSCTDVLVTAGQTATCTIHNARDTGDLKVIKHVINDNGGNNTATEFTMHIKQGGSDVVTPFAGSEAGSTYNLETGTYVVSETGLPSGYTQSSIVCDGQTTNTVNVVVGQLKVCTITNDDQAPSITLNKVVTNDNGGNASVNDFGLTIGGTSVTSGQTLNVNANTPIALNEAGLSGYTFVSLTGAGCPSQLGGTVTLTEGQNVTCTITNNDVAPTITLNKFVINDNGGNAGVNDFGLTIGGTGVTSGQTLNVNANSPIALNEAGLFGYTFVSLAGVGCPTQLGGTATLNEGQNITCTITNDDVAPQLTVYKVVINDDGGTAQPSDFTLNVNATDASPSQFDGSDLGTLVSLDAGDYEVTEDFFPGYTPVFGQDCVGTIGIGETKTCVVTNTDDTPHLIVVKHMVNDNGGNNLAGEFTMEVTGTDVSDSEFPGSEAGTTVTLDAGDYSVDESGPDGYTAGFSNDCQGTISLGQTKICTITNDDQAADLDVQKDGPASVQAGDTITYTIAWQVLEPGFASNATLVDTLPSNVSYVSADCGTTVGQCDISTGPGTVNWELGTRAAPDSGAVTLTVQTNNPERNGTLVHNDVVFSSEDNQASDDHGTTVESDFTVNLEKSAPATVNAGDELTFTLDWSVDGNSPIDSLILTDAVPTNTSFVSASDGGTETAGLVSWDLGAHLPGDEGSVTLTVQVATPLAHGTEIDNTAEICGQTDGIEGQHCDEGNSTTEVNSDFTVTIDKSDNTDPVAAGGQIVYTLDWTLSGNAPIDNLIVTDTLPANTTFVSASNGGVEAAGVVTWNLGAFPSGNGSGSETVTVNVASPLSDGTELTDLAEICGQSFTQTEQEVIEHCNDDAEITTVASAPILSIVKSNDVAGFTNPGKEVTYTVTVANAANATETAQNVIMTDVLPAGFTFNDGGNSTKSFGLGDLAPGASVTTVYTVTIDAGQNPGTYPNTATAEADNHGPVSATSEVEIRRPQVLGAVPEIDLSIVKSVNPEVANPGRVVTYTLTVKNTGDADASNVSITDTLPAGFTFVEGGKSSKTFVIGTLAANHTRVINYEVRVGNDVKAGDYKNTAVLTADGTDPLVAQADLEVRVPRVLSLATTGVSARDYFVFALGLSALAFGLYGLRRRKNDFSRA